MLRDNLVELIEPMLNSAGADPLALYIHTRTPASDDRLPCLKNPRPEGAESSLTESASSPFQAEPAQGNARNTSPRQIETYLIFKFLDSSTRAVRALSQVEDTRLRTSLE